MALHRNLTGPAAVHPFAIIAAADPGAIGAGKAWLDTSVTPHKLRYRNAANSEWEDIQGSAGASQAELDALTGRVETLETDGAPPGVHTHDDRYYTEAEMDTALGALRTFGLTVPMSGGGEVIPAGVYCYIEIPVACIITAVRLTTPSAASLVLDLWADSYVNFPPTVADSITASAKPKLSVATTHENTTLAGWTKSLAAGSWLAINVESGNAEVATLALRFART